MDDKQLQEEQELAKILAGVNEQIENDADASTDDDKTTVADADADLSKSMNDLGVAMPQAKATADDETEPTKDLLTDPGKSPEPGFIPADPVPPTTPASNPVMPEPTVAPTTPAPMAADSDLEAIKKEAIQDLRPLVDKLNLPEDEKFDTYLLLLRSTDDSSLIKPAYEAAKIITDETKKAQALLDIVKEIDYLSNNK